MKVKIPEGYRDQLEALGKLFSLDNQDPKAQPPYFGDKELESRCPDDALALWEGPRGLEEYAREIFPLEEEANGMTWMFEEGNGLAFEDVNTVPASIPEVNEDDGDDDSIDEGLVMRGLKRDEEAWLA